MPGRSLHSPAQIAEGEDPTWVKSQWENPSALGQFSVATNTSRSLSEGSLSWPTAESLHVDGATLDKWHVGHLDLSAVMKAVSANDIGVFSQFCRVRTSGCP